MPKSNKNPTITISLPNLLIALVVLVAFVLGINWNSITNALEGKDSNTEVKSSEKIEESIEAWKGYWNNQLNTYCQSEVFQSSSPEFQRGVSLVMQRFWENEFTKNSLMLIRANQSCLDIQYATSVEEMSGADGVFLFSKEESGPKGLKIFVNPEYKLQDDVVTALLLSHELTHAEQFIYYDVAQKLLQKCRQEANQSFCDLLSQKDKFGYHLEQSPDICVRHEAQAFSTQNVFFAVLKKVEQDNITLRANNVIPSYSNLPVYNFAAKFRQLERNCPLKTQEDTNNFINCLSKVYVTSEPFYQKQCGL